DIDAAKKYQDHIEPLRTVLHKATSPVSLKTALNIAGITVGPTRLPAKMPTKEDSLYRETQNVISAYQQQGIV
ncbi:dihydrodipicolinate synthase family protein, partial [Lacticaseibacillus chiayiensis]